MNRFVLIFFASFFLVAANTGLSETKDNVVDGAVTGKKEESVASAPLYGGKLPPASTSSAELKKVIEENSAEIKRLFLAIDEKIKNIESLEKEIDVLIKNQDEHIACQAVADMKKDIFLLEEKMPAIKDNTLIVETQKNLSVYKKAYTEKKQQLSDVLTKYCPDV